MKKIIGLVVFVVAVIGGYLIWQELQKSESTDDAEIDGNVVAISARVAGHVNDVLVEDGQLVKKGDVMVKLDPKDFEVAVERAKADLNNELANLQTSRERRATHYGYYQQHSEWRAVYETGCRGGD